MTRPSALGQRPAARPAVTITPGRSGAPGRATGAPGEPGVPDAYEAAAIAASSPAEPLTSRTVTVDDPLTTSLLAEISRRQTTIDVTPEQIDEVHDLVAGDADRDDPT